MNRSTSGWSAFRITIFAARRVFPPLLITPANASNPRMKLSGPEAFPPPCSVPFSSRNGDRFDPVPDPNLNSIPSVFARSRIDSSESCTELMKHAEHCGRCVFLSIGSTRPAALSKYHPYPRSSSFTPTLNHTGELKLAFCVNIRCASSYSKFRASAGEAKYPPSNPQPAIVPTTRCTSCATERSRSGVSILP